MKETWSLRRSFWGSFWFPWETDREDSLPALPFTLHGHGPWSSCRHLRKSRRWQAWREDSGCQRWKMTDLNGWPAWPTPETAPQDLLLNKCYMSFWLKQPLVKDSVKLHKCKHVFALPWAGIISIDVVMVIISCWSKALISSCMCLWVLINGEMNFFIINAIYLVDRNLSKCRTPEGRREHYRRIFDGKRKRRPPLLCQLFCLSYAFVFECLLHA